MTIFIVTGESGEYSSRNNWLEKAFTDRQRAQTLVDTLTADNRRYIDEWYRKHHGWSLGNAEYNRYEIEEIELC